MFSYSQVYFFIGHVVLSYMVAFGVSLLVEGPMLALEKIVFPKEDVPARPQQEDIMAPRHTPEEF